MFRRNGFSLRKSFFMVELAMVNCPKFTVIPVSDTCLFSHKIQAISIFQKHHTEEQTL